MTTSAPSAVRAAVGRLPGPDVVRAVALIGVVVMNFHGYLILRGGERGETTVARLFDPWTGPLSTRFAATFVLVAGVGVTLLARRSIGNPAAVRARRWTLLRRGLTLYVFGLWFDTIWPGTILPYYGAMFMLAALLFTLRARWVLVVGAAAALAGAAIAWWRFERVVDGGDVSWLTAPSGPRGLLLDVFVNGTHPLLPWLAFFCTGIVLGRVLATSWWRPVAIAGGLALFVLATMFSDAATGDRARFLASTDPFDRGLLYTASALGTALAAFAAITWLADRAPRSTLVGWLGDAGRMSLTLYIAHALVFNFVVDWLGWIGPTGLDTALLFAAAYWVVAITAAVWWRRSFGLGPAERAYRFLGG